MDPYPSYHLIFQGSFNSAAGRLYDVVGDGPMVPVDIGGASGYKYTVNLIAFPRDSNFPKVDFGVLEGKGPINGPSKPDSFTFNIRGTPNSNGYRLDLDGFTEDKVLFGTFDVLGGGGVGRGDLAGSK